MTGYISESEAEERNHTFLRALSGYRAPRKLVWTMVQGRTTNKPYRHEKSMIAAKDELAEKLRTDREPCLRCGVRHDLHANHGCGRWRV